MDGSIIADEIQKFYDKNTTESSFGSQTTLHVEIAGKISGDTFTATVRKPSLALLSLIKVHLIVEQDFLNRTMKGK